MSVAMKMNDDHAVFKFKGTHPTVVNALRRMVLDEVPTFAVDTVEVVANETPLYDETVAHRLGLIPLKTDLKSYNFKKDCKCGGVGCALCEVTLSLKQETPGYVLSKELKSNDPKITVAHENIPITKIIKEKSKVELSMKAVLGHGRDHAKWAPAHSYLKEEGKDIDLIIEPFGQLEAKEIYNTAISLLQDKIKVMEGSLK